MWRVVNLLGWFLLVFIIDTALFSQIGRLVSTKNDLALTAGLVLMIVVLLTNILLLGKLYEKVFSDS